MVVMIKKKIPTATAAGHHMNHNEVKKATMETLVGLLYKAELQIDRTPMVVGSGGESKSFHYEEE
jgi:hypothetical protein